MGGRAVFRTITAGLLIIFSGAWACFAEARGALPEGFVYLRAIDPTIVQDVRYATPANFTGAIVPGYQAAECILRREVAEALKQVQQDLRAQNFALKVYDCYRPARAVKSFVSWAQDPGGGGDPNHYPRERRDQLIKGGYIAALSGHSKGTAVDLTIVPLPISDMNAQAANQRYGDCISQKENREPDNSADMGTSFDCFDVKSNTKSPEISAAQSAMRQTLVRAMEKRGFQNYHREWWHFSFPAGIAADKAYNFTIVKP
jgi:D-alanyl-D-alanine dipeptidase